MERNRGARAARGLRFHCELCGHADHSPDYLSEANAGQTPGLGAAGQPLYTAFLRNAETQEILPFSTPIYNALQLNLKHAFYHGMLLTAAYTYSKSIDQATDDDSVPLFNALSYLYRDRAVSDFDRTHVFDAGFTAGMPFGKGQPFLNQSGVVNAIFGGWRVNGVVSKYTGLPFTPTASATSLNAAFNTQVANKVKPYAETLGGIGKTQTWFDTRPLLRLPPPASEPPAATRARTRRCGLRPWDRAYLSPHRDVSPRTPWRRIQRNQHAQFRGTRKQRLLQQLGHITSTFGSAADQRILRVSAKLNSEF